MISGFCRTYGLTEEYSGTRSLLALKQKIQNRSKYVEVSAARMPVERFGGQMGSFYIGVFGILQLPPEHQARLCIYAQAACCSVLRAVGIQASAEVPLAMYIWRHVSFASNLNCNSSIWYTPATSKFLVLQWEYVGEHLKAAIKFSTLGLEMLLSAARRTFEALTMRRQGISNREFKYYAYALYIHAFYRNVFKFKKAQYIHNKLHTTLGRRARRRWSLQLMFIMMPPNLRARFEPVLVQNPEYSQISEILHRVTYNSTLWSHVRRPTVDQY